MHLNTLTRMPHAPDGWSRSLEFAETAADDGLELHPMFATQPPGRALLARVDVPVRRDAELPRHADARRRPARERTPARPGAPRRRCATEIADPSGSFVRVRLAGAARRAVAPSPNTSSWLDQSVTEIADEPPAPTRSTRSSTSRSTRTSRPSSSLRRTAVAGTPRPRSERMIRIAGRDGRVAPTAARTCCRSAAPTTPPACSPSGCPTSLTLEAGGRPAHVDPRARDRHRRSRRARRRHGRRPAA